MNNEKIAIIQEFKEPIIIALDTYLKQINELITYVPLVENEKIVHMDLSKDAKEYENLRDKLNKNDFNLSPLEISKVSLILFYQTKVIDKQIKVLTELRDKTTAICNKLF